MYSIYDNLKTDREYKATTGLSEEEFTILLNHYKKAKQNYPITTKLLQATRDNYEKKLDTDSKELFFILFYFKTYPTFDILGLNFNMSYVAAKQNIVQILPYLEFTLSELEILPMRSFSHVSELKQHLKNVESIIIDATENQVNRPANSTKQKGKYSGKKKAYRKEYGH